MLVLKRKENTSLVIMIAGKAVKVTLLKCHRGGHCASLGITADADVHIVRSELLATGNDKEVK